MKSTGMGIKEFLADLKRSDSVYGSVRIIIDGDPQWIKLVKKDVEDIARNNNECLFGYFIRDNIMFIDSYGQDI